MTSRRSFLIGAASLLAAPAIVRAESLMKLYVPRKPTLAEYIAAVRVANLMALQDSFVFGTGFVEYPRDGSLPHVIDPRDFDPKLIDQSDVDLVRQERYVDKPFGDGLLMDLKFWNPPDPNAGRKIVGKDWPWREIRTRA